MLLVAHELKMPLSQVELMTTDELTLHMGFMRWKSEQELKAVEKSKAQAGGGQKMQTVAKFSRR